MLTAGEADNLDPTINGVTLSIKHHVTTQALGDLSPQFATMPIPILEELLSTVVSAPRRLGESSERAISSR